MARSSGPERASRPAVLLAALGIENRRLPIGIGGGDYHLAAGLVIEQCSGLAVGIPNLGEEVLAPVAVENQPAFFLRFRLARRRG